MIIGKLRYDEDLLEGIIRVVRENNIKEGAIFLIGAVKEAVVGYYIQSEKRYIQIKLPYPQEIVSAMGNISLKDGDIFPHIHIVLSDEKGETKGGHLMGGTKVFACEYTIIPSKGLNLKRAYDETTGLFLLEG